MNSIIARLPKTLPRNLHPARPSNRTPPTKQLPSIETSFSMGGIISAIAVTTRRIKKKGDKNKEEILTKQETVREQAGTTAEAPAPQQSFQPQDTVSSGPPFSQVVPEVPEAVRDEGVAQTGGGIPEAKRDVGIGASVPLATTTESENPPPLLQQPQTNPQKRKEKMASDEDYTAFLDKVNQDPNEGFVDKKDSSSGKVEFKAVDSEVPPVLVKVAEEAYYVSDADEPFVVVALKFKGKVLPDESAFAKLVNHPSPQDADVDIMDIGEWDPQGQYKDVVEATREASQGSDVRVYRIGKGGARVEYWVVGLGGGRLVGVKALGIES